MGWNNCLNSKEDLRLLLSGWLQLTNAETIGDPSQGVGVNPLIKLRIGGRKYVLNQDTKREGVKLFLENERNRNQWTLSETNRVSNALNGEHIAGLHMYKN
ncbi:hypothetical protein [uncultured Polaribacter sp.]|uniref:hypothetical protein n=1 Tax=uncultured Polaribacter sp. TaxID=174711 RepID=UPI0026169CE3|nr:hypothetical protein [uncultured Polaribacter sp.]